MLELFYKLELKGVPRLQKECLRLRLDAPFAFQNLCWMIESYYVLLMRKCSSCNGWR